MESVALGGIIRETRRQRNEQQKVVAHRIGVSAQYLNDIEHGRRSVPHPTLRRIAAELDLPYDALCVYAGLLPNDLCPPHVPVDRVLAGFALAREVEP